MALLGGDGKPVDLIECTAYQFQRLVRVQQGQVVNPCLDGRGAGIEGESTGFFPARQIQIHCLSHVVRVVSELQEKRVQCKACGGCDMQ